MYSGASIRRVTIPAAVTSIGSQVFTGCSGLEEISVSDGNPNYASVNGMLLTKDGTMLVQGVNGTVTIPNGVKDLWNFAFYNLRELTSVAIPDTVTTIRAAVFSGCTGLTSVTIPSSVTFIGFDSFWRSGLTSVTIPDNVTSLGDSSFLGCTNLTSATIGNGLTNIEKKMFLGCIGLTSITIPNGITSIGENAFKDCTALASVVFEGDEPTLGTDVFIGVASGCKAYVDGTLPGWSQYPNGSDWNGLTIAYKNAPAEPEYHTITFVCDSTKGTMSGQSTQQVESGQSATPPTITAKTGWKYNGWSSNAWQNASGDATVEAICRSGIGGVRPWREGKFRI